MDHGHREGQALALAQRQGIGQGVHDVGQAEALRHLRRPVRDARLGQPEQPRVQDEVLPHRQLTVEREGLRHVADAAARVEVARIHRLAEQRGPPLAGRQQAGQHLHGGGLAAPVRAQEAEDLPARDAEAHVVDGHEVAEPHGEVVGLDGRPVRRVHRARRDGHRPVPHALRRRQQRDEGLFQGADVGARQELVRGAGVQHASGVHGHQPVEARGLLHVGGGHQDAHAGPGGPHAVQQLPELPPRQRVDARGRLVQDEEVGIVDQRAAQAQLLLHAPGELPGGPAGEGRQPRGLQQGGDPPLALQAAVPEQPPEEVDVLEHRQRRVQVLAQPLRHVGDPRAHPAAVARVGHVAAQHLDPPGLDGARPGDQREEGGLPHAVRADHADHASGGQVEGDRIERPRPAVAQADVLQPGDGREGRIRRGGSLARAHGGSFTAR